MSLPSLPSLPSRYDCCDSSEGNSLSLPSPPSLLKRGWQGRQTGRQGGYDVYETALKAIPPPGSGCHPYLLTVANYGHMAGLSDSEVFADIRHNIPAGKRRVTDSEITDAIRKAADSRFNAPHRTHRQFKHLDVSKYRERLVNQSDGATEQSLVNLSPFRLMGLSQDYLAAALLDGAFMPGEHAFIGHRHSKKIFNVDQLVPAMISAGPVMVPHVAINPFTGHPAHAKSGAPSYRCDAAISKGRHILLESDTLPMNDQLAIAHSIITRKLLHITAVTHSGGKSLHLWVYVDPSKNWHIQAARIFEIFEPMGFDGACRNPSRLSRLPGYQRPDGGQARLLYLNPVWKRELNKEKINGQTAKI